MESMEIHGNEWKSTEIYGLHGFHGDQLKIQRNSIETLLKLYRNSIEILWKFYRNSIGILLKLY